MVNVLYKSLNLNSKTGNEFALRLELFMSTISKIGVKMMGKVNKLLGLLLLGVLLGVSNISFAGEFDGTWLLSDTHGGSYEATLSLDGKASGTHGEAMKHGSWKEENGAILIEWAAGWKTRISKDGDNYIKTSFKPGTTTSDTPTDISNAKKLK